MSMTVRMMGRRFRVAPLAQGLFFAATGLWPILHLRSFEAVTGPKVDRWLVKTIGGLIAVVGATLVVGSGPAARRRWAGGPTPAERALRVLGIGAAAALAMADVVYVARRRIAPVYLADAVAEAGIITGWIAEDARR